MKQIKPFLYILIAVSLFTGCAPKIEKKPYISKANFQKTQWKDINGFEDDDLKKAFKVFKKDCKKAKRFKNLKEICKITEFQKNTKDFFKINFTPYKLIGENNEEQGLITGYYEPILKGSLTQSEKFKYPVYKTPNDLLRIDLSSAYPELKDYRLRGRIIGNMVIPYDRREDIDKYPPEDLEAICYVDNKVDLFFMQIQGSGKVQLEDGTILNIGYAEQNGHPYYAIGRKLIEDGHIEKEDVSLQSIKKWLEENPEKTDEILNLNQSYVFFRNSENSATGSLGTELTANRNLAVDRNFIPLGFPVFIDTTNPITKEPIQQLMVAADTGGAIKGEIRADYFFGNGKVAKELAGKMKQKGSLFILVPNNIDIKNKGE
jgi:membrane-bound lytic murein transglycosylase A